MVRVAGLKGQQLQDVDLPSADGLTPTQQLQAIAADADRLITDQQRAWHAIYGELARAGIEVVGEGSMATSAEAWLGKPFLTQVFPIHPPQALEPAHPFPFLPTQVLSVVSAEASREGQEGVGKCRPRWHPVH